jgi:hypothetical protein
MGRLLLVALLVTLLAMGCGRHSEQKNVQNLMEKQQGQKMNASSRWTLAEVKDKLREGMRIEEFDRVIAERNQGPNDSTNVMSHPLVEGDPPKANLKKESRTYYLWDADLIVVIEFVGAQDEPLALVVSWHAEPLQGD